MTTPQAPTTTPPQARGASLSLRLNLIVAMSAFRQPFGLLVKAAVPFIVLMVFCLGLVVWQPWIAMYLVNGKF